MSLWNCGVLVPPMNAQSYSVECSLVLGNATLRCAFASYTMNWCSLSSRRVIQSSIVKRRYLCVQLWYHCWECPLVKVWSLGLVSKHWYTVFSHFCHLFACCHFYYRITKPCFTIHITCILPSLHRTSAPIQLTIVLGVLGTQETSCILIAGLLERDIFDLFLPEFDKPWVIHLRETCCCCTNLCTWRPNTVYKNRSVWYPQV